MNNVLERISVNFEYQGISKMNENDKYRINKFNYELSIDNVVVTTGNWFCGTGWNLSEVTEHHIIHSVALDCSSYMYCYEDIELNAINEYMNTFGYEDIEQATKCYNICKKSYDNLSSVLTDDEISFLSNEENYNF